MAIITLNVENLESYKFKRLNMLPEKQVSNAVPMTEMLLNVVTMLLATKKLSIAESSLKSDIEISTFDGTNRPWSEACYRKFYAPIVTNALAKCGVPQTDAVYRKLMLGEHWPHAVFSADPKDLPEQFVFDPDGLGDGLVGITNFDLLNASKSVLMAQIPAFVSRLLKQIELEHCQQLSDDYGASVESLLDSNAGIPNASLDGASLWNTSRSILQELPFVKGVANLPEPDQEEVVLEIYSAFCANFPSQTQPDRERSYG